MASAQGMESVVEVVVGTRDTSYGLQIAGSVFGRRNQLRRKNKEAKVSETMCVMSGMSESIRE